MIYVYCIVLINRIIPIRISNIQSEETDLRLEYVFYFDKSDWNKYTREKTSYHSVYSVISYNFIAA